jgi:hypothetical protein
MGDGKSALESVDLFFSDKPKSRFVYDNHSRQEIIRNLHPRLLPRRPGDALLGSPPAI